MRSTSSALVAVLLIFPCWSEAGPAGATSAPSHCRKGETSRFSCKVAKSGKVLSLCEAAGPALFYRFGALGKVELEYPPQGTPAAFDFTSTEDSGNNSGTHAFELSFRTSEAKFTVRGLSSWARGTGGSAEAGVDVLTTKGVTATFACTGEWLWPDVEALENAANPKVAAARADMRSNLVAIRTGLSSYYAEHDKLPYTVWATPSDDCCKSGGECAYTEKTWIHATWKAIGFSQAGTGRYRYSVTTKGSSFTVRAEGDPYCKGLPETWQVTGDFKASGGEFIAPTRVQ